VGSNDRVALMKLLREKLGEGVVRRNDILHVSRDNGFDAPVWLMNGAAFRVGRGLIDLSLVGDPTSRQTRTREYVAPKIEVESDFAEYEERIKEQETALVSAMTAAAQAPIMGLRQHKMVLELDDLIPKRDSTYVPFGFFKDLTTVLSTRKFYPIFVTGLSGNGKTVMVEQACARLGREMIRVNITEETDEDDLIGGQTLIDGNVVARMGPVLIAMERGAVLLLDEIDRGGNKLMAIQGILEGKPYFNKKTGQIIYPRPGFTIIATANTKGQGSMSGKFISAKILDDALLERFAITVEQEYPNSKTEKRIVMNKMMKSGRVDESFADNLISWAEIIRKTYADGGVDELISTRRLEHIVKAYAVFGKRMKAIDLCIARFDDDTKASFHDLYMKVDADAANEAAADEKDAVAAGEAYEVEEDLIDEDDDSDDDSVIPIRS
jgi:MoxR-like ATPase